MTAIYKKELRSYFTSMIGYVYIAFFLVIVGIYFVIYNLHYGVSSFEYVLQGVAFLFIILTPILTMRILAEEKKQKTDQLLLTSPITPAQIIIGKYLAVFTVFLSGMAITLFYPLILMQFGKVDLKLAYIGMFGFVLMGMAYLAVGMFISALTENQVVAAVTGFVVMLLTYLMPGLSTLLPADAKTAFMVFTIIILICCVIFYLMMHNSILVIGVGILCEAALVLTHFLKPSLFEGSVSAVLSWFSIVERFDSFIIGNLDLASILYYFSIAFAFIFLSVQSLKKRRWS